MKSLAVLTVLLFHASTSSAQEPRHYMFVGMDRESIRDTAFLNTAAFEGAQIAYFWKRLEPKKDEYDFSAVREDLEFLAAHGKKLWVQFQDATFTNARTALPAYLLSDSAYHGGAAQQYLIRDDDESTARPMGTVSRRWDPVVQSRMYALYNALGREFDGRIAGINTEETSITVGESGKLFPPGFSNPGYRDAIIANMHALRHAFPTSIVMVYGNFMPGEWRPVNDRGLLRSVYDSAKASRVALGGPDLLPHRPGQLGTSYPLLREAAGVVPTGIAVQDGNLAEINPATSLPVTIPEVVEFARSQLRVTYIFWGREEPYLTRDILPFLRRPQP